MSNKYISKTYFSKYVKFLKTNGLYPSIYPISGPSSSPIIKINGKKFLTFCSNNYLGLANNIKIEQATKRGINLYGVGSGSTRLLSGTLDIQTRLEKELADFLGFEDSITFSSGYLANIGTIRMLVDPFPYFQLSEEYKGTIISDELNHASIIDSIKLSKAERIIYKHSDTVSLEKALINSKGKRKLIITDGVFSMEGDLAKLKEITALAKKYDALTFIDDSHGIGVLGLHGEGTAHHLGVERNVDVIMGSFTKAFGSIGGFIAATKEMTDYLRVTARSYIFSDPIPPAIANGLLETVNIIKKDTTLRQKVLYNSHYLRDKLENLGFIVSGSETTIVPILINNEEKAIKFYEQLFKNYILAPCIRRPAVPEGKERIRFSIMATHEQTHLDTLLSVCEKTGKSLKII